MRRRAFRYAVLWVLLTTVGLEWLSVGCAAFGGCESDGDCSVGQVCLHGQCVERKPGEFVLRVTDSPVEDVEARVVVEGLSPDYVPKKIELFLDGKLLATFKMLSFRFTLDTRSYTNGRHDLWLRLTDAAGGVKNGRTSFMVRNPSVDVVSAETPTYAYPGQILELWIKVTGRVSRIEPDFSAIDAGFSQKQVRVNRDGARYRISYIIPENPTGEEGSYDIPIAVIATDGSRFIYRGLSFYLGAGPLMPFESKDGILRMESIPTKGAPDAALYVSAMSIAQPSIITGSTVDIDLQFQGDTSDARVLIGLRGWGGHLLIPVSSLQQVGATYRMVLHLPDDSIEGRVAFRFEAVAMDSAGRIGVDR